MVDTRFPVSIHIMTVLALHGKELTSSELIAKSIRTNPTVVRRLVSKLVSAGLIQSYKGKMGGIRLAKSASLIHLSDIYCATEHSAPFRRPKKNPLKACPVSCAMGSIFKKLFVGIEKAQLNYLESISLQQIANEV